MQLNEIERLKQIARERFAAIQAKKLADAQLKTASVPQIVSSPQGELVLNEKQLRAVELIASGESCCLIGPAGTGKTTTTKAAITALLAANRVPMLIEPTKVLAKGVPGVVGLAFTRRAAANLAKQMPAQLKGNVMTFHALLEYEPVDYEVPAEDGGFRMSMRFEPQRNANNLLPSEIQTIVIDESSMVSVELFKVLLDAIGHEVQFVFLGDIQQLAPVFGEAILGFKLLELETVELTHVYRQALESPIIRLAHRILSGKQILPPELSSDWQEPGKLTIARWPANTSPERAEAIAVDFLTKQMKAGNYNPEEDMVLIPFNKHFGTYRMGRRIAGVLDAMYPEQRKVQEVIAGFTRHYFAAGDRVIFENELATIKKLLPNPAYKGKLQPRHALFTRFGTVLGEEQLDEQDDWMEISVAALAEATEDGVTDESSHQFTLVTDDGRERVITGRGQVNKLMFAYCTTVHKAQGLQAPRVFLLVHKQHAIMVSRELLYTASTRAQHALTILCDNTTFMRGINKQQIKGTTLAEKAEYFKGKQAAYMETLA